MRRSGAVTAIDVRPEDLHGRPARSVIDARRQTAEVLRGDPVERVGTDADQVDAGIGLDAEERQHLVFLARECGLGHCHGDCAAGAFVHRCCDSARLFALGHGDDDAACPRQLERREVDLPLGKGRHGEGQQQKDR